MASFSDISIRLKSDLSQFSTEMQNAQRDLNKISKRFRNAGRNLSIGLTAPIVALGVESVRNFDKQAKALAQVESALKSTGNAANKTFKELQDGASDLQNNSLFGDEEILQNVTAQLLTFTNVANEQFDRTQQAALDLATRLDGDLKGATIQLGKALNDPIAGLSALGRSGIQFIESQKEVIKSLAESGRLAEAQTIILDELEKQYGGAAAAAANAGTGPLKQLSNILGDITEDFGKIILEALTPFIAKLKEMAIAFQNLSPQTKKVIVIIAGLAAALGPVLVAISAILPLLPAIAAGFAALAGPVGLAVAAMAGVGVVIANHWGPIKQRLIDIANYFIDLYNESVLVRSVVQSFVLRFKTMYAAGKFVLNALVELFKNWGRKVETVFEGLGEVVAALLTGNFKVIPTILKTAFSQIQSDAANSLSKISKEFDGLITDVKKSAEKSLSAIEGRTKIKLIATDVDVSQVSSEVNSAINTTLPKVASVAVSGGSSTESGSPDVRDESGSTPSLNIDVSDILAADEELSGFQQRLSDFKETSGQILSGAAQNFAAGFGQIVAGLASGNANMSSVFGFLLKTIADVAKQLGEAAIAIGLTMEGIKASFSNPFTAIAAGVALIAVGALIESAIPAIVNGGGGGETPFASGGLVFGPTRALVGEYQGARNNPEVIAPLNKLRDFIQPQQMQAQVIIPDLTIRGSDMKVVFRRQNERDNRRS